MAKNEEAIDEPEEIIEAEEITEDKVKGWIAEAIEGLTGALNPDAEDDVDGDDEVDEPQAVTMKDVEEATRRAVEEAMKPLRAAKKAAPKKAAAKPKPDPEPMPVEAKKKSWSERLWGTE